MFAALASMPPMWEQHAVFAALGAGGFGATVLSWWTNRKKQTADTSSVNVETALALASEAKEDRDYFRGLVKELEPRVRELERQLGAVEGMRRRIADLEGNLAAAIAERDDAAAKLATERARNAGLTAERTGLIERLAALEREIAGLRVEIAELRARANG